VKAPVTNVTLKYIYELEIVIRYIISIAYVEKEKKPSHHKKYQKAPKKYQKVPKTK
jgi:hypothetical protein